jgi:hypothetical protein
VSGVFPIDPHTPTPEHGPSYISRTPASVRDAPPGFKGSPGTMLEAKVLGRDSTGHLMLRTQNGVLTIATGARPPTGSTVTIHFRNVGAAVQAYIVGVRDDGREGRHAPARGGSPRLDASGPAPQHGHGGRPDRVITEGSYALTRVWPALEEALDALHDHRATEPGALTTLLARLPQPGATFGSRLLFYLAALQRGEVRAWLDGAPLDALTRIGREDLVTRIDSDFAFLADLAATPRQDWRLYVLPVLVGGHAHQLRVFVHSPPASESRDNAHRVVAETDLPALGEIQLDALLRRHRLDMILRTRTALDPTLQDRIRDLAAAAAAWGRVDGDISFTAGNRWHFLDLPSAPGDTHHQVLV